MFKDVFRMINDKDLIKQSRAIFFTNEFEAVKTHYKRLKDLAIEFNPSDRNYIEYLELEFNRTIESFIEKASVIE
jgi:hypothetical protein